MNVCDYMCVWFFFHFDLSSRVPKDRDKDREEKSGTILAV